MTESWGESLYRAAAYIAAMVALLAMVNFIANFSESEPIVPLPAVGTCCDRLADWAWLSLVLDTREAERVRHDIKQV